LTKSIASRITVIKGDAVSLDDVMLSVSESTDVILFAIGVDEKNITSGPLYRRNKEYS
jgi:hypothetical protein